jgi:hypothetical protein
MDAHVRDCGDFGELPFHAILMVYSHLVTFISTSLLPLG